MKIELSLLVSMYAWCDGISRVNAYSFVLQVWWLVLPVGSFCVELGSIDS